LIPELVALALNKCRLGAIREPHIDWFRMRYHCTKAEGSRARCEKVLEKARESPANITFA